MRKIRVAKTVIDYTQAFCAGFAAGRTARMLITSMPMSVPGKVAVSIGMLAIAEGASLRVSDGLENMVKAIEHRK